MRERRVFGVKRIAVVVSGQTKVHLLVDKGDPDSILVHVCDESLRKKERH